MPRTLRHARAHDYKFLIQRWRKLAPAAGLVLKKYSAAGGYDLYFLASKTTRPDAPSVYLSAGIHGDEAGATEGLYEWAETHVATLRELNLLIFPCINAWGLVNNSRRDMDGNDLNRCFNNPNVKQITAQLDVMTGRTFDVALHLHEDYDAEGVYIYEIQADRPYWAADMIRAAGKIIPADMRSRIEGRAARSGIVRRPKITPDFMPDWPEAFILYFRKVMRVFTVETPSEFHLDDRIAAHGAILSKAVALCRKEFGLKAKNSA